MKHGDRNTHFFHGIIAHNSIKMGIHHLNIDGELCSYPYFIKDHVPNFYYTLFTSEKNLRDFSSTVDVIPSSVSEADNLLLLCLPIDMDIKKAIFDLDPHNTPRPDGFTGLY